MAAALWAAMLGGPALAAASEPADSTAEIQPRGMGKFVTALCQDLQGNLWAGTEDTGVWRFDAHVEPPKRWTQFTRLSTGGPPEPDGPTVGRGSPDPDPVRRGSPDPAAPVARSGDRPQQPAAFLGDDHAYALACDKLGRVWVGHLNHGVSVYNGREWRNYDVLTGPLGERVFDIETCPADGDVWIASSAGLARYRVDDGEWCYYTRADGLPAEDVQCLAFAADGTVYAGTQCDGLAVSTPTRVRGQLEYRAWRVVRESVAFRSAKEAASAERKATMPDASPFLPPCGEGLPSDLINDVLVARDGAVYAATITGLAASRDKGRTWQYVRGRNWEAKARGLYRPPSKEQLDAARKTARDRALLAEDYVTCLAEDGEGNLWLGYREKGFELFDPRAGKRLLSGDPASDKKPPPDAKAPTRDYTTRLLAHDGHMIAATYGAGLSRLSPLPSGEGPGVRAAGARRAKTVEPAPFPLPAAKVFPSDVRDLAEGLSKLPPDRRKQPLVIALPDDWRTQGDWLGRYGRYFACCAAICSPLDYVWGAGDRPVDYRARIGPHCTDNDSIRYWVHWLYTDDRRTLEMPPTYAHSRVVKGLTTWGKIRRQAEWDDHGEAYPRTHEGPDLYCTLKVPEGLFFLSLYDFNKDGHAGNNRFRDYQVSIRAHDPGSPSLSSGSQAPAWEPRVAGSSRAEAGASQRGEVSRAASLHHIDGFGREPELARTRIHDFWGGVWKRFLVQGPAQLTVHVARNDSFNTILAGVMLDLVDEAPPPYFAKVGQASSLPTAQGSSKPEPDGAGGQSYSPTADLEPAVRAALARLAEVQTHQPAQWAIYSRRAYATLLRAAYDMPGRADEEGAAPRRAVSPQLAGSCAYHCALFPDWEREQAAGGATTARAMEKALRWDEKTYTFSGRGRDVLAAFRAAPVQRPLPGKH